MTADQNCRAFLFAAAGISAALSKGASKVLMFESGVGALNVPPMVGMETGARTTKGSHPQFLRMMSELGSLIGQRDIAVELPYKDFTKGELVRTLAEDGLEDIAKRSVSCVHHSLRQQHARQCGVCPACIGRRQAMAVAGIEEDSCEYAYDIFASAGSARASPPEKLDYLAAILGQVADFEAIGPDSVLPEFLRVWLTGSGVIAHAV